MTTLAKIQAAGQAGQLLPSAVENLTAWLGSILILAASFWLLVKLNRTFVPEKRIYTLES